MSESQNSISENYLISLRKKSSTRRNQVDVFRYFTQFTDDLYMFSVSFQRNSKPLCQINEMIRKNESQKRAHELYHPYIL